MDIDDTNEIRSMLANGQEHKFGSILLEWAKEKWMLQLQIESEFVDRVAKLSSIHARLFNNFEAPRVKADIHAIWASHSLRNDLLFKNNWGKYTSGQYSEEILQQGNHYSLMMLTILCGILPSLDSRIRLASLKNKNNFNSDIGR